MTLYNTYDYLLKILIIGDAGTGKSCMMTRFVDKNYSPSYFNTVGVDFKVNVVNVQNKNFKLQIWDTAGQERFRTITSGYYRGSSAIILCYDVSCRESFINIKNWMNEINVNIPENRPLLILSGNKCDMIRTVEEDEGKEFAKMNNMLFFETSAKSGFNVENIFNNLVENYLLNDIQKINYDDLHKIRLDNNKIHKSKSNCC